MVDSAPTLTAPERNNLTAARPRMRQLLASLLDKKLDDLSPDEFMQLCEVVVRCAVPVPLDDEIPF